MLAQDSCGWALGWTDPYSLGYGVKEAQAQA